MTTNAIQSYILHLSRDIGKLCENETNEQKIIEYRVLAVASRVFGMIALLVAAISFVKLFCVVSPFAIAQSICSVLFSSVLGHDLIVVGHNKSKILHSLEKISSGSWKDVLTGAGRTALSLGKEVISGTPAELEGTIAFSSIYKLVQSAR